MDEKNLKVIMKNMVKINEFVDSINAMLGDIIEAELEPLLKNKEYKKAKIRLREFYKDYRFPPDEFDGGEIIPIEHNLILGNINRLIANDERL